MNSGQQTIHKYLVLRSQQGDRQAQNELYKLYVKAMYNICVRMMRDEEEAKDVLQEAFITAFSKIGHLEQVETFSAWIKRIVVNHCINALKRRKVTSELNEQHEDMAMEEEDIDYRDVEVRQLMGAIEKISDGCRTVLNLYAFEGYDHKEIAQILSISESASKAQYSKAKSKIRKILAINK